MRQEQVVFAAGVAILGMLTYGLLTGSETVRRTGRSGAGSQEERERFPAPGIDDALVDAALQPTGRRALFSAPRDTRPLPPLDLVEPPRQDLPGLLPPTVPGPAVASYGALLRREAPLVTTPDLFESLADPLRSAEDDAFFDAPLDDEPEPREVLADDEFLDESPEQRATRLQGYRARYDWVTRTTGPALFGRIQNEERFGLLVDTTRTSEPLLFVQVDPETGIETFRATGAVAVPIDRGGVREFGFANTPSNELETRDLTLGDEVTRGSYDERLGFAAWCVAQRLAAPGALATARRVYRSLAAFDPDDPAPRLGLARTLEAGFDFEGALLEYRGIVDDFPLEAVAHVGLAQLESRFLLFEQAEQRFRRAVEVDRGSWEAQHALGRFLNARGRQAEALEHLEAANRAAPTDPGALAARVGIRNDLGAAHLGVGDVDAAARSFASAASADSGDPLALAGRMVCAVLADPVAGGAAALALADEASVDAPSFELRLAESLAAISAGDAALAEQAASDALTLDPLRATLPLATLAYVASTTGYPDEAIELAERALEADPSNAYAHYLRGRLLGERDAYEEARAALLAALEVELDFEDALVSMGDMAFRLGRFEDAERYLERAVTLGTQRAEVHALRGLNLLRLERVAEARNAFEEARAIAFVDPVAQAGLAWCTYLDGDATEALVLLADLDESRRDQPEDDPWRQWATGQQERISDHVAKQEWVDTLDRKRLLNDWQRDERNGPTVRMVEGTVALEGAFQRAGLARLYRSEPAGLFVSFEASVWVDPTAVRAGVFVARERARAGETEITDEVSVSRHKDGATQVRVVRARQKPEVVDMEAAFPVGRWVRLRIERVGEGSESRMTVSMDGVPLLENLRTPSIGSGSSPLLMGLFAEGEVGREAAVKMDDVSVVRRQ